MIKQHLIDLITNARLATEASGALPALDPSANFTVEIDTPKQKAHGDFATNVALVLAKPLQKSPREVAQELVSHMKLEASEVEKIEIAGPGFINFTLKPNWMFKIVEQIICLQADFGMSSEFTGKTAQVEFVSANPNGPITVAHGRGGAIGDALASLLSAVGYTVEREFYINDALNSKQMNNFGKSVHFRYMQQLGVDMGPDDIENAPEWLYRGDYVVDIACEVIGRVGDQYKQVDISDPENIQLFRALAQEGMQKEQESDLEAFGIKFDHWYSESTLHESGAVTKAIGQLTSNGYTYVSDGAVWLKSTEFGDDKDRVLLRADSTPTYIAGDIAYHQDKYRRNFDKMIDVWGADHGGYVARTKAGVAASGNDPNKLFVLLFQLVRIMQGGEMVRASKRRGNVLELRADLIDEIGKDAARFFFLMRSSDTSLDIDIDLAKEQSAKNPVYYVQYAHARCCRIIEKAEAEGLKHNSSDVDLSQLKAEHEFDLIKKMADLPDEISYAAKNYAPHHMTQYVRELASTFHLFYDAGNNDPSLRVICDDPAVTAARIQLVHAARITLKNSLTLLGLDSPVAM